MNKRLLYTAILVILAIATAVFLLRGAFPWRESRGRVDSDERGVLGERFETKVDGEGDGPATARKAATRPSLSDSLPDGAELMKSTDPQYGVQVRMPGAWVIHAASASPAVQGVYLEGPAVLKTEGRTKETIAFDGDSRLFISSDGREVKAVGNTTITTEFEPE